MPSFASRITACMILAKTLLSLLGRDLQPPAISRGVLLKEAQNIHRLAAAPRLFPPSAAVVMAVLALNFFAVAVDVKLILADEVTSTLDVGSRAGCSIRCWTRGSDSAGASASSAATSVSCAISAAAWR